MKMSGFIIVAPTRCCKSYKEKRVIVHLEVVVLKNIFVFRINKLNYICFAVGDRNTLGHANTLTMY